MKHYLLTGLLAAAVAIAGCARESDLPKPTGEGDVRAINAIPTSPNISFLIEERLISAVEYKSQSSSTTWDDLDYTFNFNTLLAGAAEPTRIASQYIDVVDGTDYTMLISGALEAPDITLWETSIREWAGDETVFEMRFANASPSLGTIDAYVLDAGSAPAAGNAAGTVGFTEITPTQDFESQELIIVLTPAGDDSTILFQSEPITPIAGSSYIVTTFEADANDVRPFTVILMNTGQGLTAILNDINTVSTGRFFHASINAPNADIYVDDPLTTPVVAGHTFGDITSNLDIPFGSVPITYTVAGNTGSIIVELEPNINGGRRYNFYLSRNPDGADVVTTALLDRRSIETQARLSIAYMAANHPVVDLYIVPTGETIDERFPILPSLRTQTTPVVLPLQARDYDVYLTEQNEKNIILGPEAITLDLGDVVEAIIYDTVDPNIPAWSIVPPP
jgi:hypothetical protein